MENIVNLEQLDYRDQLIKEYIDEHSSGGSSDYNPVRVVLTRKAPNVSSSGSDKQHLYIGFPEGTDISDYSLLYMRSNVVRNLNKAEGIAGHKDKWKGLHQVWKLPVKDKIPLIVIDFKDKSTIDFTKDGYDYYEIGGVWGDVYYSISYYINQEFTDWRKNTAGDPIYIEDIMSQKKGGIIVLKEGKPISNHIRFRSVFNDNVGWRITL